MKKGISNKEPKGRLMKWVHRSMCLVLTLIVAVGTLSQSQFSAKAEEYNLSVTVSGPGSVIVLDQENSQEVTSSYQKQIEEGREVQIQAVPQEGASLVSLTVNGQDVGADAYRYTADGSETTVQAVFEAQTQEEESAAQESEQPASEPEEENKEENQEEDKAQTTEEEEALTTSQLGQLVDADKISESDFNAMSSKRTLKSAAKDEATVSSSTGNNVIESLSVNWISPEETTDKMTVTKDSSGSYSVRMRLEGSLSGQEPYEVGDITISIPKTMWTDRNGNSIGTMSFSVPQAPDTRAAFAYSETEDFYVLTNTKKLAAATAFYFEFTVSNLDPVKIKDLVTDYETEPFYGVLTITSANGQTAEMKSNEIVADLDTKEVLNYASALSSGVSKTWNSSWPSQLKPDNPDDYYYASWYVYVSHQGSQTYTIDLNTEATDEYQGEVLGLKYGNTVYEGNAATLAEDSWQSDGNGYYATVYTAYPISEFEEEGNYDVSINAAYTMTPTDDKDQVTTKSASAKDDIVVRKFFYPYGFFQVYKTGNRTYNFAINDLLNGNSVDLEYTIHTVAFGMPWTVDGDKDDLNNYFKKEYTVTMDDDDVFFNEKVNGLRADASRLTSADDYEFKQLYVAEPNMYTYAEYASTGYGYVEVDGGITYKQITAGEYAYQPTHDSSAYPDLNVYDTSSGEKVLMATISWNGNSQAYNGASLDGTTVIFPHGVTSYETEYSTKEAAVIWYVYPTITLKPSDNVVSQVQALNETELTPKTSMSNIASMDVYSEGQNILTIDEPDNTLHVGVDTIAGPQMGTYASKKIAGTENDTSNRLVTVDYEVDVYEQTNLTNTSDYAQAFAEGYLTAQTEGTFYDLLPYGYEIDLESVKLRDNDLIKDVQLIKNYKDSGRNLLVVKAELTPVTSYGESCGLKGYRDVLKLTYSGVYSWENIQDLGRELDNRVAFESGNGDLGTLPSYQGEYNANPLQHKNETTLRALKGVEDLMTDLPSDNENAAFVYASSVQNLSDNIMAVSSLSKQVSVNGNGIYGDGQGDYPLDVYELGSYTYRLRFQDVQDSQAEGIIIYDSLENWTHLSEEDVDDATWQGTLKSVDTSLLVRSGVAPVVYWSSDDLNLYDSSNTTDCDLTNGKWHVLTSSTDLSKVKHIAVDCSKAADGSDFVLAKGEALMFYVNMQAPEYTEGHAYNAASILYKQNNNAKPALIYNEYTKVGLRQYSIDVQKTWDDADNQDGKRTDSVTVDLMRNGTKVDSAVLSDENDWKATFDNVLYADDEGDPYFYTFEEEDLPDGYTMSISKTSTDTGTSFTIKNTHSPEKIEISGTKTWENDDEMTRPDSVTIKLYANGTYLKQTSTTALKNWTYSFANLPKYSKGEEIEYTIEETYSKGYVAEYDGYNIANTYSPYGTLEIEKSVENGTEQGADQDFTFTLTLTELDGTTYRTGDYQYVTSDGREGIIANGGTLTLKAGQSAQVLNVDSETLYSWSESNESGYTLTNTENAEGTLQAGAVQTAKFTNTYKTRGTAYVKVAKEVENHAVTAGKFSFVLKDENGEIVQKASARADGSITFPAIFYSNEDNGKTFDYTVEEVQGELPGYTYDTSVIRIQVTPVDNGDGTMTCTVSYPDSEDGEMPAFKNIYNAKGSAVITAWKQLTGRDLENEEFTFELLKRKDVQAADEDDSESDEEDELLKDYEVIATAKNDINGNINFEALNFTEQDVNKTYEYIVREVAGDDDTVQYSDQTFSYTLTISDNDDGTLSIQQERGQEDLPVFVNKLKSGSVSVTKRIDGETDPTKEFTFRIKITSPAGSELGDSIKFERKQVTDEDDEDEGESKDSEATE